MSTPFQQMVAEETARRQQREEDRAYETTELDGTTTYLRKRGRVLFEALNDLADDSGGRVIFSCPSYGVVAIPVGRRHVERIVWK